MEPGTTTGGRSASPLTPEQRQLLIDATKGADSFMGAAKVAGFNAWSVGFFAVVSILFGLFSLSGFVVGVGLAVVTRNEFVGRKRIRALDLSGLELLWRNQVGFMVLIIAYCIWSMYTTVAVPDPQMTELTDLLGEGTGEMVQQLTLIVYGAVIVATVIFQGLNARYYFLRVARMTDYLRETPGWVIDLQRAAAID
jgi:hypothetical protein